MNHTKTQPENAVRNGECGGLVERLLVTPKQAAQSLAISERTLWTLTDKGEIKRIQIGRCVRYDLDDLRCWIEKQKAG
jgi:excisionase family DNA binding protein